MSHINVPKHRNEKLLGPQKLNVQQAEAKRRVTLNIADMVHALGILLQQCTTSLWAWSSHFHYVQHSLIWHSETKPRVVFKTVTGTSCRHTLQSIRITPPLKKVDSNTVAFPHITWHTPILLVFGGQWRCCGRLNR